MLQILADDGPAPCKMRLVRRLYSGRGLAGSYATIDRLEARVAATIDWLEARGLVRTSPGASNARRVEITDAGRAAIA